MSVRDVLGREIALLIDEVRPAARHVLSWSPERLSGGIYFIRMEALGVTAVRKAVLLP